MLKILLPLLLLAGSAAAGERARELLAGLEGMTARFEQRVTDATGRELERSTGEFAMQAPNLFRWHYRNPYEQLIVADGRRVWLYDVDLEQVTVRDQAVAADSSPLSVLTRPETLEERYRLTYPEAGEGVDLVALEPLAGDAEFERVTLRFVSRVLDRLVIDDAFGQRTLIAFDAVIVNPELEPGLFRFAPPPGVDVLGMDELLGPDAGP